MKTKLILLSVLFFLEIGGWSQNKANKEWIKNPITSTYSLKYEQTLKEDLYKQNQQKYASNVDMQAIDRDIKSVNEERRLSAIKILGLIPISAQISKIEDLLVNDPSLDVRIECAKSLKYLNSTNSIPQLIKALQTNDAQLKLYVALTLAALGEKTECLKKLTEIGKYGDRNTVLNTHIGYLDIATDEAIIKLKTDLSNENPYISVDAAIVLSELGYSEVAFPILKEKLSDEDKYIRLAAMRGLAYIGNDNSLELIRNMLNDSDILIKERSELILNTSSKSSSLTTSYNPANAASYAEQWYDSFNPAYANYDSNGGDCANFGSQCLKAGGMNLSSGPGLDKYGCIIACDNLHTNFTTYQGCNSSSTYSGHKTSSYPTWFTQGDIVLFGANASNPSDPWQHTAINVVTGTPALDAHSNSRHKQTVSYFYPSTGTGFKTADFYHFTASITQSGYASVSSGITVSPSPVVSGNDFSTTFTLKETKGYPITFESVICAILKSDNTFLRDMEIKGPITIAANGTYSYSSTLAWRTTDPAGSYTAVARGKVSGGDWFDFTVNGGTSPKSFQVNQVSLPGSFTLTLTPQCNGTTSQIILNWTASSGATSYDIYRDGSLYYSGLTGTTFTNTGSNVVSGTTYQYYIKAKNASGSTNSGSKSAVASNCSPTPTITVTSPNGGENWQAGSTQSITWTSSAVTGTVQIQPYQGSTPLTNIAPTASNTGSYSWTIPSNYTPATTYRIGISAMSGTVSDLSNSYFTISSPSPVTCSINSLVPNYITHNPAGYSTGSGEEIIVNGQANCNFNVTGVCSWFTVTPMSGTTNSVKQAFLNYSVQANTSTSTRQCTFYVNESPVTITQTGCTFGFSPTTKNVSALGTTYNLDIDSYSPCSWNIQNSCSWVHPSQLSGTGDPTISVTVDPNTTCDARTCTLIINPGNATHVITQPSGFIAPVSPTGITASRMSIVNGQSTTLQVVGGALNSAPEWIWYTGTCGGTQVGTGLTLIVSPITTTTYYVQATSCGISTNCKSITINNTTAVNDVSESAKIKINPNPTTGKFEISGLETLGGKYKVEIFNHQGVSIQVSEYETIGKKISLDLSDYPVGMYLIKISNNGISYQKKVVKK